MNSYHFEHHAAIEFDMVDFMEDLSNENICGKLDVRDDGVHTKSKIIDCKTEDSTDLGDVSSISVSELDREGKVRKFQYRIFVLLWNNLINTTMRVCGWCWVFNVKINLRSCCFNYGMDSTFTILSNSVEGR